MTIIAHKSDVVLNIKLIYDRQKETLLLQQLRHIHTIIKDYNLQDAKLTYIPIAADLNFYKTDRLDNSLDYCTLIR